MADGQVGPVLALEQAAGGEPAGGILLGVDHTLDASGLPVPQPLRPGAVLDGHGILPNTSLPDVLAHKIRAGYAAGITWMDEQAGKVLDTLERVGHKDDTIVLFTAE